MEPAPDEVEVEGRRRDRVEISHLKELYRKAGFSVGPSKLLALARQKGRDINLQQLKQITLTQVRGFLDSQPAFQIHQPGTKGKTIQPGGKFNAFSENEIWFIDLLDFSKYASVNKIQGVEMSWALICIDVFTRKGYLEVLPDKKPATVSSAFRSCLDRSPGRIDVLQSDNGTEFIGEAFQSLLSAFDPPIVHITADVGDHYSLGIVDAFAKLVKRMVASTQTATGDARWVDKIQEQITQYNKTPHDSFPGEVAPDDVTAGDDTLLFQTRLLNRRRADRAQRNYRRFLGKLQIGDSFRVRERKGRGYEPKWSTKVYVAESLDGRFVRAESGQRFPLNDTIEVAPVADTDRTAVQRAEETRRARRALVRLDPEYTFKPEDQRSVAVRRAQRELVALDPAYSFPAPAEPDPPAEATPARPNPPANQWVRGERLRARRPPNQRNP